MKIQNTVLHHMRPFQTFDQQMSYKYETLDILLRFDKDDQDNPMHYLNFNFLTLKAQCGHEIREFNYTKMKIKVLQIMCFVSFAGQMLYRWLGQHD